MRLIGFQEYNQAWLTPVMDGLELTSENIRFHLDVVLMGFDDERLAIHLKLYISEGNSLEKNERKYFSPLGFPDRFSFKRLSSGSIELGTFARKGFDFFSAFESGMAGILSGDATLKICLGEPTEKGRDVHFQLMIGDFVTATHRPFFQMKKVFRRLK